MTDHSRATDGQVDGGRRSIARNFRSIFLGRLFAAFSMWLALLILAKLSDPQTVGIYAFAQTIGVSIAEIAKAGLKEIYASDTTERHQFGDYFGFRLVTTAVALVAMLSLGVVLGSETAVLAVVALYALIRCTESVTDIIHGFFQSQERMEFIGRSLTWLGASSMLMLSLGYWLSGSLVVAVAGQLAAALAILGLYDLRIARGRLSQLTKDSLRPQFRGSALRDLGRHALPLAIATCLAMVAVYLPRLVVEQALDLSALGYFAAITAMAMAPNRLVNSLGMAVAVRLAHLHASGERATFLRLLLGIASTVVVLGALGVLITMLYGEPILAAVYTEDYASYSGLLVWATIAMVLRSTADVLKFGMVASRQFWAICTQYGVVAVVAAVGCATLIPRYGLDGAGLTMVAIYLAHLVVVAVGIYFNLPKRLVPCTTR